MSTALVEPPVLNNDPPIYLIFWGGAEFSDGQGGPNGEATAFFQAAQNLFAGPYLSALAKYDASLGKAHIVGPFVDTSEPNNGFSTDDLIDDIARRVLERLSDQVIRDTVADTLSRIAEQLVREEIERIKSSIKP